MDDLTRYVFFEYGNLRTAQENAAYKSIVGKEKAEHSSSPKMQELLHRRLVSEDPDVLQLLAGGTEQFFTNTRERILREHTKEVFLNLCPRCGQLARPPQAKQCRHCFLSWHEQQ